MQTSNPLTTSDLRVLMDIIIKIININKFFIGQWQNSQLLRAYLNRA